MHRARVSDRSKRLPQGKWSRILAGVLTVVLLAPIPAFAAVVFTTASFGPTNPLKPAGNSPISSISWTDTPTDSLITFSVVQTTPTIANPTRNPRVGSGTIILTSAGITASSGSTLNGTWSNLNVLNSNPASGKVAITVNTTNGVPNNMFTLAPTNNPPASPPVTTSVLTGNPTVTIKFQFTGFFQSSSASTFTLDLHN